MECVSFKQLFEHSLLSGFLMQNHWVVVGILKFVPNYSNKNSLMSH